MDGVEEWEQSRRVREGMEMRQKAGSNSLVRYMQPRMVHRRTGCVI